MIFDPIDFESLNEADVREEIIAPLLRYLGYRSGTENNIIREQSLRYPRIFIGRKDAKKDPILRGIADYICCAGGAVQWVIEAKSPDSTIGSDEIDQAYTYANHPEIQAVYYCITNGRELKIYQTNQGPMVAPILSVEYESLDTALQTIENLLGPAAILRDHPRQSPDVGQPIGPGLRSIVRITNGSIIYKRNSLNLPNLNGLTIGITEGAVERDENNCLVAFLRTLSPYQSLQTLNERLGVADFEATSEDQTVSVDPSKPTTFRTTGRVLLAAGERVFDTLTWREVTMPTNVTCETETIARGHLDGQRFKGDFFGRTRIQEFNMSLDVDGDFEIYIA